MLADLRGRLLHRISEAVGSWRPAPLALWLFGSAARGEGTADSDIDLLIVRPSATNGDDQSWRRQSDDLSERVSAWSGNDCQILEYSSAELSALVKADDPLVEELRREAIVIAGRPPLEVLRANRRKR
jgi:predicted nucleotidyltransferase